MWKEGEMVLDEDNEFLFDPFQKQKSRRRCSFWKKNKAAGPDNIPIEFYQSYWPIVKNDIMKLFEEFHKGSLEVSRLNYGVITLLPKVLDANKIQQFRPICMMNCLYEWFTKVLSLRLDSVADKLILNTQSAFMKGRNIMNGVLALHEILHETKKKEKKKEWC